jgi:hypothetical protein
METFVHSEQTASQVSIEENTVLFISAEYVTPEGIDQLISKHCSHFRDYGGQTNKIYFFLILKLDKMKLIKHL